MTKAELQAQRRLLITKIDAVASNSLRMKLQAELSAVNAEIKKLNIEKSTRDKRNADVKSALGKAEERANLERAKDKTTLAPVELKPHERTYLTPGEYIVKTAKQLLKAIEKIKPANRLEHTKAFEQPLRNFVAEQKLHVKEYNLSRYKKHEDQQAEAQVDPDAWKRAWTQESGDP